MVERLSSSEGHSDGLGAIYPPMMYSVMALDVLGLRRGPSAARGSFAPVQQPDGGRWRAFLLPAVLFAGVGHRHRRLCGGAERPRGSRGGACRGLAARARSASQGRLEPEAPRHRTLRLGLRIRQRVLPGYRRHRHGDAGPQPGARFGRRRAAGSAAARRSTGCSPCSRAMAAGPLSTPTTIGSF